MRTRIIIAVSLAWLMLAATCRNAYPAPLTEAVRAVESAGNDRAVGDQGRSRGPMQCQRAAWIEACQYGKVQWDYDTDVWDREKSAQVFLWYGARYGAKTDEQFARAWNSGPSWRHKLRATDGYWRRVKAAMGE